MRWHKDPRTTRRYAPARFSLDRSPGLASRYLSADLAENSDRRGTPITEHKKEDTPCPGSPALDDSL